MNRFFIALVTIFMLLTIASCSPSPGASNPNNPLPAQPEIIESLDELSSEYIPDRPTPIPLDDVQGISKDEFRLRVAEACEEAAYNSLFTIDILNEYIANDGLNDRSRSYLLSLVFDSNATANYADDLIDLYKRQYTADSNPETETMESVQPQLGIIIDVAIDLEMLLLQNQESASMQVGNLNEIIAEMEAASTEILSYLPTLWMIE